MKHRFYFLAQKLTRQAATQKSIYKLGYKIDDGEILLERSNQFPLKVGDYQGEAIAPQIIFDISCREQIAEAKRFRQELKEAGLLPETKSRSSYGSLSQKLADFNLFIQELHA